MAVSRGTTNSATGNADASGFFSLTLNVAAGNLKAVIVSTSRDSSTTDPVSMTVGGNNATLVRKTSNGNRTIWTYIITGVATGNNTVTVRFENNATSLTLIATDYSDVHQTTPTDADNGGTGTFSASGGTASVAATSTKANGYLHGAVAFTLTGQGVAPNSSETELADLSVGSNQLQAEAKAGAGPASESVSWINSSIFSGAYAAQIVILKAADQVDNMYLRGARIKVSAGIRPNPFAPMRAR